MALRKYKSSKEGVRVTAIFFVIMLVIISTCKTAFSFSKLWFQGNVN